jgi:phenylalanine ammonia-lyase
MPAFSNGLPSMLIGNTDKIVNGGLQSLQLCGNCIMPQLQFYGNALTPHFPAHADGFNQNINSQGFGSANLARRSVEIMQQYLAIALLFGVQAVDLRTHIALGHYDASGALSRASSTLYAAILEAVGRACDEGRPLIRNDDEQQLDAYIDAITDDIRAGGRIVDAVKIVEEGLCRSAPRGAPS